MRFSEFVADVSIISGVPRDTVREIILTAFNQIKSAAMREQTVSIKDFGKFVPISHDPSRVMLVCYSSKRRTEV